MVSSRIIDVPCPHTVEAIRRGLMEFAALEWTPEKKKPLEVRVHPESISEPLPKFIDGVPIRICHTSKAPSILEMDLLV